MKATLTDDGIELRAESTLENNMLSRMVCKGLESKTIANATRRGHLLALLAIAH